jgi:hypothetical protein
MGLLDIGAVQGCNSIANSMSLLGGIVGDSFSNAMN